MRQVRGVWREEHSARVRARHLAASVVAIAALLGLAASASAADTVLERVNAGGPYIAGTPSWSVDTKQNPSPFVNATATGNKTHATTATIDTSHASIPEGTPAAVFQTARWDPAGAPEMLWDFPATAGDYYRVRLYFAEIEGKLRGQRVFDVSIDGKLVLDDFDVYAAVGANKGIVKSFLVTSDGNLDIDFGHVVDNPSVNAIEILSVPRPPLEAAPASLEFGSVVVNWSKSASVKLTHGGAAGDPAITVSGTSIGGTNPSDFADSFDDAAGVTLAPGESTTVAVTFAPKSSGAKSATLSVAHTGKDSPLAIPLTGEALGTTVVHRVNAGGPTLSATPSWGADSSASPSPYTNASATGNTTFGTSATIDTSHPSVPAGAPAALFQTERWDGRETPEMEWNFPVTPGQHEVRLYFAEIYDGAKSVGARVFDVSVEGKLVLDDFDVYAAAGGGNKAIVKSFLVTTDSNVDVDFGHVVENPAVKGIEILATAAPNTLAATPAGVDFPATQVGASASKTLTLTNAGGAGDPSITVSSTSITGTDAGNFSDSFDDSAPVTLAPGESKSISVSFSPFSAGTKSATLAVSHSGKNAPLAVPLSGSGAAKVVYRVNAGGPALDATPSWSGDTAATPSSYTNASATGNTTYGTSAPVDTTHPSVPAGTPAALFQSERWDGGATPEMQWDFPVTSGRKYEVRLYFAEIYDGAKSVGARVFDVSVEGKLVLDDFDVYAAAGGNKGIVKSFLVTADSNLDVDFGHVVENPSVKAIEILDASIPNKLEAVPSSVELPSTVVGSTSSTAVELTNVGSAGDPSITVSGTSIGGTNASEFRDSFNDAASVTLAPGESTRVTVTFAPTSVGKKSATLSVSHSGKNTPLQIGLGGEAVETQVVYRVNAGGAALSGTPSWSADTYEKPSAYTNASATGNSTFVTSATIDTSHPSVPAGTPAALFQSERWDGAATPEMQWDFPVQAGGHEVRLYFAEIYDGAKSVGARVFDVSIEGKLVLDDFDVYAAAGGGNKGIVKSFLVTTDSNVDIDLGHVVENPAIKGIEILAASTANKLAADPTALDFTAGVGSTTSKTLTLTNAGATGAPSITVSGTSITGTDAADFSDSFDDSAAVTLAPGQSTQVTVKFTPTSSGDKSATLSVAHSGANSPLSIPLAGTASTSVSFGKSVLKGATSSQVTSLQFGADGRLYAAQQDGLIKVYTIVRNGPNDYSVTATETITTIREIPNHNDDGTLNAGVTDRLITGILVVGTASNPVVYVASSDPRIGGGSSGEDTGLDTNSTMISRLTWSGSGWTKLDLIRGLPRSEENHAANGMQLDPATNTLYVTLGGNTNQGARSNNFALLPEFAYSAAILKVDLSAIGNTTYDLPTLDDENRVGSPDANDPFGGNNGKNQAKIVAGGPVQIYAPGFRNPYDVVIHSSGRMYTIDNGGNAGWGDIPINEGPDGKCTNDVNEPGLTEPDMLHLITGPGYYGGHPNPTRGNKANTFNANAQSPVPVANPVECDYRTPGVDRGDLTQFPGSTNGLVEYRASNFDGAMKGDLITASFDNTIYRIKLNETGDAVVLNQPLFSNVAIVPLDVTAQPDGAIFPGTIWTGDIVDGSITVFEPAGASACTGADDPALDEDGDGYKNADEIDNGTNPCSAADIPPDWDGDHVSNLNDPDDDNDGISDVTDPFAIDAKNGTATSLPVRYTWDNDAPKVGGILGLGFTGLMTNGTANYESLYSSANMTAGGAAGVTTVDKVPEGDALASANTQKYGLQFGVKPPASGFFTARTRIMAPFAGLKPQDNQSMGLFVGTGGQDDYVKLVTSANGGAGGIQFVKEVGGVVSSRPQAAVAMPGPNYVDLFLTFDVAAKTVQPSYVVTSGGVAGPRVALGAPEPVPSSWLSASALAVGIISTSAGAGPEFPATWDFIEVLPDGKWEKRAPTGLDRQEVSYVLAGTKFYLAGGGTAHQAYDPATDTWANVAPLPAALDHIQGVEVGGLVYYVGGLVGWPGPHTDTVYIYNPATNTFTQGAKMPAGRARGAGGVAAYNGKIYYAGGLHNGAAVAWFDVYDPVANTWTQLPDMPRVRDHFHAAVVNGKFYAIGGRNKEIHLTTDANDVYTFATGAWSTGLAALPTPRGGFAAAVLGDEIFVIGGEGGTTAYNTVEAYNTATNKWRALAPMATGRHGIQAVVCNGGIYVAAGGTAPGHNPSSVHEVLFPLGSPTACTLATATKAEDRFTRTVSGGWGKADIGGDWSLVAGSAPNFSVDGAKGVVATPGGSAQQLMALATTSVRDVDYTGKITFANWTGTSGGLFAYFVARRQAGGAYYRVAPYVAPDGKIFIRGQNDAGTSLFADVATGLTYSSGVELLVRIQLQGANPTSIRAKVWKGGTAEPSTWMASATDSTAGPQTAGSVAIRTINTSGTSATVTFDDVLATALP